LFYWYYILIQLIQYYLNLIKYYYINHFNIITLIVKNIYLYFYNSTN
jgi:hypothetical protein